MSIGEIIKIALVDTALGMGTVFLILIFISLCIWLLGRICGAGKNVQNEGAGTAGAAAETSSVTEAAPGGDEADTSDIDPEVIAAITAAIHQYIRDENGDNEEYVVRNVRRATWKHTS